MDTLGNLYVADFCNDRVQVFGASGDLERTWESRGSREGEFNHPYGIAVDANGEVYVTDKGNHRVQVFTTGGEFLRTWGSEGKGAGQFEMPNGIAVDQGGNIYVADGGNRRVQVFSPEGTPLNEWAAFRYMRSLFLGGVGKPQWIAADGLGNLYVTMEGALLLPSCSDR